MLLVARIFAVAVEEGDVEAGSDPMGSDPRGHYLDHALHHFAHIDGSRSLVELLPLLPSLEGGEQAVARFLVAAALDELGLSNRAKVELEKIREEPALSAAASVALARIHSSLGADAELLELAAGTPWDALRPEDAAEIAYRAAKAAYRQERFGEVESWLERTANSSFSPFAAYLRAQTAFATGDTPGAIASARPLIERSTSDAVIETLRDRAAILLGDLYTELGRYGEAVGALSIPDERSPFAARARRDLLVAEGLQQLTAGEFTGAGPVVDRLHAYLASLISELGASVDSKEAVEERLRELRGSWPSRFATYGRRDWTVARARQALDALGFEDPSRPGGLYQVFLSMPVRLRLRGDRWEKDPWVPDRERTARFFFPPSGDIARWLRAVGLLEDRPVIHGTACPVRAATGIRRSVALWLLEATPPPNLDEIAALASGCREGSAHEALLEAARTGLGDAIRGEAHRQQETFRRDRLEIEMAIGRAWLEHVERLEESRRQEGAGTTEAPPRVALRRGR